MNQKYLGNGEFAKFEGWDRFLGSFSGNLEKTSNSLIKYFN